MRVLFLADHRPDRAPGQRFRYEQYLPYLRENGIHCDVSFLLNKRDDRVFYGSSDVLGKARIALRAFDQRRVESTAHFLERYDVVFVFRGALFFGPPWVERRIKKSRAKLVFDFDDAIWTGEASKANRWLAWLKFQGKVAKIMGMCDAVVAGNTYLGEWASSQGARRVEIIPTTIDTEAYLPVDRPPNRDVVEIGWTGSFSTISHFETRLDAFEQIREKYGDRVRFKVVGDASYRRESLGIEGLSWRAETEVEDLRSMDIGIMPLADNEFMRGKCALKGLQYMALGMPTVMSPVGVNTDVVTNGENGLLASTTDEWVAALSRLIDDAAERKRLGDAGRRTVVDAYSIVSQRKRYVQLMRSLASDG